MAPSLIRFLRARREARAAHARADHEGQRLHGPEALDDPRFALSLGEPLTYADDWVDDNRIGRRIAALDGSQSCGDFHARFVQ